jgi:hypothetical protein
MMAMPVTRWETEDGQLFQGEVDAIAHEKHCKMCERITRSVYNFMEGKINRSELEKWLIENLEGEIS